MYPSWENMKRDAAKDLGKPIISCAEYAHAHGLTVWANFQGILGLMRLSTYRI
jgi:beta-galactosidase